MRSLALLYNCALKLLRLPGKLWGGKHVIPSLLLSTFKWQTFHFTEEFPSCCLLLWAGNKFLFVAVGQFLLYLQQRNEMTPSKWHVSKVCTLAINRQYFKASWLLWNVCLCFCAWYFCLRGLPSNFLCRIIFTIKSKLQICLKSDSLHGEWSRSATWVFRDRIADCNDNTV